MTLSANTQILKRNQTQSKDTWDVSSLYPSFEAWTQEFESLKENSTSPYFPSLSTYKGKLGENPNHIKQTLDTLFSFERKLEKLYTYAHLKHDEEITLEEPKRCLQQIMTLYHEFQQEASWISPQLLSLSNETLKALVHDSSLKEYQFFLEKILRKKAHTLSEEKEELIALAGKAMQTPSSAFSCLNNADLKFDPVLNEKKEVKTLTHGLYQLYLRSSDRTLRKNAFLSMQGSYQKFKNTLAELLQGQVQNHLFSARSHHYDSCLTSALYPKNIDPSVYLNLIETVRSKIGSLHNYVGTKKKLLGLEELHLYDMYVPVCKNVEMHFSYEEAQDLVIESVAPLGKEYQSLLEEGLKKQRWVDRFENENKRSGAYSSGCFDSHPYILMNYRGTLRDVFTLAHEAGHSMHSLLSRRNQPYHEASYPIFVAEVASTFNESLLMDLLLKKVTSPKEKAFLIQEKIEDIRATLFRQTMFAEFELKIHQLAEQSIPLTPQLLDQTYFQLNQDYFGPHAHIDQAIAIEWARIPHFYYYFYVYQYATGISAALALVKPVLEKNDEAVSKYLTFLSSGGSQFPLDLLKTAGVDMTTKTPVEKAIAHFDSLVSELQKLKDCLSD